MLRILSFCIFLILSVTSNSVHSKELPLNFRAYGIEDGINQPFPYDILHSQSGYIWVAGENGLWKFDGNSFKSYKHDVEDSSSLAYDFVWIIFEDSQHNLWAGTYGGGVSRYNPQTDNFTNFSFDENDPYSISDDRVRGIAEDPNGNIWLGTDNGLSMLDIKTGQFARYTTKDGLLSSTVRQIKLSQDQKKLFIATGKGLNILDLETKSFSSIEHRKNVDNSLSHFYLYDILEYPKGTLWLGTGAGLDKLELKSNKITHYNSSNNPNSLSHDVIFSINKHHDYPSKLFVGTLDGLNMLDLKTDNVQRIWSDKTKPNKLKGDNIYKVSPGRDGSLWVAVYNEGLFQYHPHYNKFNSLKLVIDASDKYYSRVSSMIQHNKDEYIFTTYSGLFVKNFKTGNTEKYKIENGDPNSVNRLAMITRVSDDIYWISTWSNFIYEWNHKTKTLKPLPHKTPEEKFLPEFNLPILCDSKKRIWIGNSERGLFIWNEETQQADPFPINDQLVSNGKHDEFISYIFEDSKHNIWIGSQGGLNLLDEGSQTFKKFQHVEGDFNSLSNNKINHISEDHLGNLWISTELGLSNFNIRDSTFTNYYTMDGLPSNVISSTIEDDEGNLWIATAEGISKKSPNENFRNYNSQDGLMDNYFIFRSAYKDDKGQIFFGHSTGLEYFDPKRIPENKLNPKVLITGIDLFNSPISPGDTNKILKKAVAETESVSFSHEQSVISFHFTAINHINGHKNKFQYRLLGYDKDWRPITNNRSTTYTNLSPGNYTFQVMASNNDGKWSAQRASLAVTILPPWHRTWWFKTLFTLSFLGIVLYQFMSLNNKRERLQNMVAERTSEIQFQKDKIEAQHLVLQQKNQKIENLLRELNHRVKNNLQLVSSILNLQSRSVKDLNAKEALTDGRMRMQALSLLHQKLYVTEIDSKVNCKNYIKDLFDQIEAAFKSNYKSLEYNFEADDFSLGLDKAIPLGLILNELITNSFKHVKEDKIAIDLRLNKKKELIHFSFSDNGQGLTESLIFESQSFGLSMIRSLVEQLNGKLDISEGMNTKISIIF
ncbi:ligand-binding sensor domain-containing protein [Echinicola shivajiensis]|uniref:ligand-binding sensor domain-containing protein n=1 Tax=Echinicola shivajiensis TaxID=1035916 RepID=UPI001BFC49F3|nr:two-component regulator propeller domain-containing protein [Echinicola shivajiensis]